MRSGFARGAAVVAVVVVGLAGCASPEPAPPSAQGDPPMDTGSPSGMVALATADSPLGTIVVDGEGMTVYQFDDDTQGGDASTCSGQCAATWPPVPAGEGSPDADGITGELGSIVGTSGEAQLTLNGWPLYYYAGDAAPGDVNGQGVGGIWWVLTPAGEPIR